MAKNVTIDELSDAIVDAVREYTDDVSKAIEEETDETGKALLETVKELAPKRTGEYAKSFRVKKSKRGGDVKNTVWSPKHYRRVHLLEFGHVKRGGGRVPGQPHMEPALDKHADKYYRRIQDIIEKGGR